MKKNIIWNTIGSLTISITSLFYTIILTRCSTLEEAGIYTIAFALACNTVTLASFGGRTYQVTDTKNEIHPFSYILSRYMTVGTTIVLLLLYLFSKDYSVYKSLIIFLLCIFKYLEEVSDVYCGILQKKDQLYKVGQFQFAKSILNVLLFFLIIYFQGSLLYAIIAMILVNLSFVLFFERKNALKCEKWEYKVYKKELIQYFKANLLICLLMFLTNYLINAPKYAIDQFLSSDVQAIFGIIIMPATVMMLVGSFIMNPLLVNIARIFNEKKHKELNRLIIKIIGLISALGLCGLVVAYFLGIPVLNFVYGLDLSPYKTPLMIIIVGSIFYTITAVLSTIFVAMRKIKSQVILNLILCVFSFLLSYYLVSQIDILGGAIAYLIIVVLRFIGYMALFFVHSRKVVVTNE